LNIFSKILTFTKNILFQVPSPIFSIILLTSQISVAIQNFLLFFCHRSARYGFIPIFRSNRNCYCFLPSYL